MTICQPYLFYPITGHRGYSGYNWVWHRDAPWKVCQPVTWLMTRERFMLTTTPTTNIASWLNRHNEVYPNWVRGELNLDRSITKLTRKRKKDKNEMKKQEPITEYIYFHWSLLITGLVTPYCIVMANLIYNNATSFINVCVLYVKSYSN